MFDSLILDLVGVWAISGTATMFSLKAIHKDNPLPTEKLLAQSFFLGPLHLVRAARKKLADRITPQVIPAPEVVRLRPHTPEPLYLEEQRQRRHDRIAPSSAPEIIEQPRPTPGPRVPLADERQQLRSDPKKDLTKDMKKMFD